MSRSNAPAVSRAEFARRRQHFMAMLEPDSIAILPSAGEQARSRDTHFPFCQDKDFHYLSGFDEPDALIALLPGREQGEFVLFCRERDPAQELWNGRRTGPEEACARFGADDSFPIGDVDDILPGLIEGRRRVYYSMGRNPGFDRRLMHWVNSIRSRESRGASPPGEFTDLDHILHELRLRKSAAELRLLRRAAQITARAHRRAMGACRPGLFEYHLEAELNYEFGRGGARNPAYPAIVGSGVNACVLHYLDNSARMRSGQLVLVDAGCEYACYAADVTRTYPVSGRFSRAQRQLYEVVLRAQLAAIAAIRPGVHWNHPHEVTVRVITEGLVELGLLKGRVETLIRREAYRDFYMHRAGHWLGLDVHDVGDYRVGDSWRELEPGMVLTVEPGIYVAPDNHRVAGKWRGIGIRIEDDVVVTRSGCEVLSDGVPKTVDEIETLVGSA